MSREIKETVLCLIVDCRSLLLARATSEMGHANGKLVCPNKGVPAGFDPEIEAAACCDECMGVTPDLELGQVVLVAKKFYQCLELDYDILTHVLMVTEYLGVPRDTRLLTGVRWWGFKKMPFGGMFKDDEVWLLRVIEGGEQLYLEFESHGPDDNRLKRDPMPLTDAPKFDLTPV